MPNHIEQSEGRRNFAMTDRPLRFCMITTFYPPYNFGGDGIFVRQLSNELARRGHHVEVIHCIDSYRLMAGRKPIGTYNDHPNVMYTVFGATSGFFPIGYPANRLTVVQIESHSRGSGATV